MHTLLLAAFVFANAQPASANSACTLLNASEVASLIGTGATTIPVAASGGNGSCRFQNGDKVVTVLVARQASISNAASAWADKKRALSGQDIAGLGDKAYSAMLGKGVLLSVVKGSLFIEVVTADAAQKSADLSAKLRATVKGVLTRM
jgi:hypothetical protein